MAWARRAGSVGAFNSNQLAATSASLALPTGWQPGDLLAYFVGTQATFANSDPIVVPAGWYLANSQVNQQNAILAIRFAQAGDTAPTFTWNSSRNYNISCVAYTGGPSTLTGIVIATNDSQAQNTGSVAVNALANSTPNVLLLRGGWYNKDSTTDGATFGGWATDTSFSDISKAIPTGNSLACVWSDWIQTTANSLHNDTDTLSIVDTTKYTAGFNVILSPAITIPSALYSTAGRIWSTGGSLAAIGSGSSPNGVKFHAGHYIWFDNTDWGTVATPHTEQTNFLNFLSGSYGQNNNISGVEIYLDYGNLDQGTVSPSYTNGEQIINAIISALQTANATRTRPLRFMLVLSMAVTQAASNTNAWPPWWVSNGYTVDATSGWTGSMVDLRNSNAVTAVNNLIAHYGSVFDSQYLLEMVSPSDETGMMGFGPITGNNSVQGNMESIYDNAAASFPTTLIRINANFANGTPVNEDNWFTSLYSHCLSTKPGHFAVGGPDPSAPGIFSYGIDGDYVFGNRCGASGCNIANYNSSAGDLRGVMPFVGHVEENGIVTFAQSGNQANPVTGGPSSLLTYWLNTNHAWHVVWNFQVNYGYWGWDANNVGAGGTTNTQYAAIASVNGATLSGTPSVGNWNTS